MAKGANSLFRFQLLQLRMSGNNFVTILLNESSQNVTTSPMADGLLLKLTKNLVKWKQCGLLCAFFNMVSWKN